MQIKHLNENILLQECIYSLGEFIDALNPVAQSEIYNYFLNNIPMSISGLDIDRLKSYSFLKSYNELYDLPNNKYFYIVWGKICILYIVN